ncbi:MBL fold metallo-hydrolase [Dactylosporangium sp. CA-233914]|uniref:MBL fold metallo-hydrolase n=1 Tax=Dactylosporangium sp. CA-233914 TaxID=3239934 RepID=UPI003D8F1E50
MTMIEPIVHGAQLVTDILGSAPDPGSASLWRLGQSGLVVRLPGATLAIDPYLSNHCEAVLGSPFDHRRLTRAPLDPAEIDFLDAVLVSHDHLDHLDVPTIRTLARTNPGARIVGPAACRKTFEDLGWRAEQVVVLGDGSRSEFGGWYVEGFAVPHEEFDEADGSTRYLGFVVGDARVRLAHLGDSLAHTRVARTLAGKAVDLIAMPINGRDEDRRRMGFAGNMSAREAVRLAVEAGRPPALPMHYDMFAQNVDRDALATFEAAAAAAALPYRVAAVGERVDWGSR